VPLALLGLNALRVRNCDPGVGLAFWALIPTGAALTGAALAWTAGAPAPGSHRGRVALGAAAILANAAWFGWRLYAEPTIVGNQWLIGYFSGSIYDEALAVPRALAWYRLEGALAAAAALSGLEWLRRVGRGGDTARVGAVAAIACLLWGGAVGAEERYDVDIDRAEIVAELGGELETEHFVITYPANARFARRAAELGRDAEFRYAELAAYLQTDPVDYFGRKVRIFVYSGTEQKGRLMGARRTLIAKIWLGEIHITWSGEGDHLLAHELAHVFSAPFGSGPFLVSAQNVVGVNMGLVEGLATAADWPPGELTPHEASAAMRQMKLAPDLTGLISAAGFWTQASGKAYTLMGSFVRWLIDTKGIARFKRAYADGDFEAAYGVGGAQLVDEWEAFLDGMEVDARQRALAEYRYTRPSIFGKVCARAVAELRRRARAQSTAGRHARAAQTWAQVREWSASAGDEVAWGRALAKAGEVERARRALDALLATDLSPAERALALHASGDVSWEAGEREAAAGAYEECLSLGVSDATRRSLLAKRRALAGDASGWAKRYLVTKPAPELGVFEPMARLRDAPEDALASYLLGRRLQQSGRHADAIAPLERAVAGLADATLRDEARLVLGMARFGAGDYAGAQGALGGLSGAQSSRVVEVAREWVERSAWAKGRAEE
jgi:tetratricopeptide (TPR) repeat protein